MPWPTSFEDEVPEHLFAHVVVLAESAGKVILGVYEKDFVVSEKADKSPVTEADLVANRIIAAGLRALAPDIPILAEESVNEFPIDYAPVKRFFAVDPLDGTKEFVRRSPEFTVNIALIVNGRPILGVVHVPLMGFTYCAAKGIGAMKMEKGQLSPKAIQVRRSVGPIAVVMSRSHRGNTLDKFLASIGPHYPIEMGSAFKSCLVAEGEADIYPRFGTTYIWDTAAGQAIVEAAGGSVIDLETSEPLRYDPARSLKNPSFVMLGEDRLDWIEQLRQSS